MSKDDLERLVEQINNSILPVNVEHDPRNPPIGRMMSAELIQLDDGEYAVDGRVELFDGDSYETNDFERREFPTRRYEESYLTVGYDIGFKNPEDQKFVAELCSILGTESKTYNAKKALDPITVLIIGGAFVLGNISSGFFSEMGSDAYHHLKCKLKEISHKKQAECDEFLQIFDINLNGDGTAISVEVIITNPHDDDIDGFLENGLKYLDIILPQLVKKHENIRKYVFEVPEGKLSLKYCIRTDGIPVKIEIQN